MNKDREFYGVAICFVSLAVIGIYYDIQRNKHREERQKQQVLTALADRDAYITQNVENDLYKLGASNRRWDLSIWKNIYATTSKPAIIHWGTNKIRIPAGSDIDITFEGGTK